MSAPNADFASPYCVPQLHMNVYEYLPLSYFPRLPYQVPPC